MPHPITRNCFINCSGLLREEVISQAESVRDKLITQICDIVGLNSIDLTDTEKEQVWKLIDQVVDEVVGSDEPEHDVRWQIDNPALSPGDRNNLRAQQRQRYAEMRKS